MVICLAFFLGHPVRQTELERG